MTTKFEIIRSESRHLELATELFDAYRQFYGQTSDPTAALEFLAARMQQGESVMLLAMRDDSAIGFTQLYPTFCSVAAQRIFVLYDLYVRSDVRDQGIGCATRPGCRNPPTR